ncbi:MAG: nucleotidyltransferase domain-containing protein [Atopobiaceae bacterium]|nr:nucleotidyltransferase domain-containing protein [Atopobiaceae bacterium]
MASPSDKTKVFTLDELRAIIRPLVERFGMRSASIFGSYARGEAVGMSDIDMLVDRGDARALSVFGIAEAVSEATGKEVDVFDVSQLLPGPFRDEVLSEAVAI